MARGRAPAPAESERIVGTCRTTSSRLSTAVLGLLALIGSLSVAVVGASPAHAVPNRLYVANIATDSVVVLDTTTNTVIAVVFVGDLPADLAVSPDGSVVYVVNRGSNTISVIDADTNLVVDTIGVGTNPFDVAFSPDGTRAYVPNAGDATVSVIDTATTNVVATIPVVSSRSVSP